MGAYECDGCGACCRTFPIFASRSDAEREPRVAAEGRRLLAQHETTEWAYRLYPLPFLSACTFLEADDKCAIYATRPDVCRAFAAGSEQCQEARRRQGLGALLPAQ